MALAQQALEYFLPLLFLGSELCSLLNVSPFLGLMDNFCFLSLFDWISPNLSQTHSWREAMTYSSYPELCPAPYLPGSLPAEGRRQDLPTGEEVISGQEPGQHGSQIGTGSKG